MSEETGIILDKIEAMKREIREIQLTLENETNRNIKLIAEGHLDLNRKLDEALKVERVRLIKLHRYITRLRFGLDKLL